MISVEIRGVERIRKAFEAMTRKGPYTQALRKFMIDFKTAAELRSPVGETGDFRGDWSINDVGAGEVNVIAASSLTNTRPYADPLEYGSLLGKKPWASAGPKTVVKNGRVWSSQAPEGVATYIIDDEGIDELLNELVNYIGGVL